MLQAEHKLVESAWPESMRKLFGPNAVLVAPAATHKKQRQILSQVGFSSFIMPEHALAIFWLMQCRHAIACKLMIGQATGVVCPS